VDVLAYDEEVRGHVLCYTDVPEMMSNISGTDSCLPVSLYTCDETLLCIPRMQTM
jgi:hypothetical protein